MSSQYGNILNFMQYTVHIFSYKHFINNDISRILQNWQPWSNQRETNPPVSLCVERGGVYTLTRSFFSQSMDLGLHVWSLRESYRTMKIAKLMLNDYNRSYSW